MDRNFGEAYFGFKIMYTQEILTLTQNKLNTLLNQATLAYQEGRAEDYARLQEQIEEVQKLIEKINS
jgi:hypothetical protein